jgi:lipopolysaccharide/colanic/teichoic acid biosynthesis glycosyltransferase
MSSSVLSNKSRDFKDNYRNTPLTVVKNRREKNKTEEVREQEQKHAEILSVIKEYEREHTLNSFEKSKAIFDRVFSAVVLLCLAPVFAVIASIIKIESKGPVFFKHKRTGKGGETFEVFKFRTMIEDAHLLQHKLEDINEMKGGLLFKSDRDPRVTKIGKIMRKYSIDELPQFINIFKGDMSVIGPRPISTPIEMFKERHLKRFAVKPGLGAIWQAYFRRDTDFDQWMRTDLIYVDNQSLKLDLKLFFIILKNAITGKGAR